MIRCRCCKKLTANKKFCSRSCSNTINNSLSPKRKVQLRHCKACNQQLPPRDRRRYCSKACKQRFLAEKRGWHFDVQSVESITVADLKLRYRNSNCSPSIGLGSCIRHYCRKMNAKLLEELKHCQCCGYDKHVELCHIKPISAFGDDATMHDINGSCNIYILCRNHHWEFDHGMLDQNLIKPRPV